MSQKLKSTLERKTERHYAKNSGQKLTDQSYKKSCDINNIVNQFKKTGRLPENTKLGQYGDFTAVPTLEQAFEIAQTASDHFMQLPSDIRKLLSNDPSQLENFVLDEGNREICEKYGLLEKKAPIVDTKPEPVTIITEPTSEGV